MGRLELICKTQKKISQVKKEKVKKGKGKKGDGEKRKVEKIYNNYIYRLTKLDEDTFTIRNELDNTEFILPYTLFKFFTLPYARTCHSIQGFTFDDEVTLFDCNTPYVDREFIWTAITRGTDLKNITVFVHSADDIFRLTNSKKEQYFRFKIEGYKSQDKKAGRVWEKKDYIDLDYIRQAWRDLGDKKYCKFCSTPFEIYLDENNVKSNITFDRIDCSKAHTKDNLQMMCHSCNCQKSDKSYYFD